MDWPPALPNIYYSDDAVCIIHADCRDILPLLPGADAVITDPPYELGFMGKGWDRSGISFRPETWQLVLGACKPGAHLLAFGGDRTHHRQMCAIEDAGWEIRTCIYWVTGQGFPKSLDISKKLRSILPSSLRCVCADRLTDTTVNSQGDCQHDYDLYDAQPLLEEDSAQDVSPLQGDALGHNRDGQHTDDLDEALAHILGRSGIDPLSTEDCSRLWAHLQEESPTGGNTLCDTLRNKLHAYLKDKHKMESDILSRQNSVCGSVSSVAYPNPPSDSITRIYHKCKTCQKYYAEAGLGTALKPAVEIIVMARKPLEGTVAENVLRYGTGALNIDGCRIPSEAIPINRLESWSGFGQVKRPDYEQEINRKGRFPANLIHDGSDEVLAEFPITASGKAEIGTGREGNYTKGIYGAKASKIVSCFADQGTAARFFYCAKASRAERGEGNTHTTVKPLALMRYLITLATPPGGVILDPFMGSGSTLVAARQLGFRVIGIELEERYCEIAANRCRQMVMNLERTQPGLT